MSTVAGSLGAGPLSLGPTRIGLPKADSGSDLFRLVAMTAAGEVLRSAQAALAFKDPDPACWQIIEMLVWPVARLHRPGLLEFAPYLS